MKRLIQRMVMVLVVFTQVSYGDTAGPNNAGTSGNVDGPGTISWTNPANITSVGAPYATADVTSGSTSEYLQSTNYGFAIPANATIQGITVSINRQSSSSGSGKRVNDVTVSLIRADTITGNNKASATDWPAAFDTTSYGGVADLWGTTWTPAEINASNFGVAISVGNQHPVHLRTASVDYMQITVTYTIPLPIQLASFHGNVLQNGDVALAWVTLSEVNNYGFYVQRKRSSEQVYFEIPNSFVPGHGTTNEPQTYSFTDAAPGSGTWMYRLKQVDLDGTIHYADPIQIDVLTGIGENGTMPTTYELNQNYPNPFNPSTMIAYAIPQSGHVTLKVYNLLGAEVATLLNSDMPAGYHHAAWDASRMASGVYVYQLTAGKFVETKKLTLMK